MADLSKKKSAVILAAIITAAIFLRFFHFHDWLLFRGDQAREAVIISQAIENGPEYLPLLGPRAAQVNSNGDYLRLGPAFYYLQYISAWLFDSTDPAVFAYPDLLFSLLTIPLLYLFARLIIKRFPSLMVAALYGSSFITIYFSRFAWNPNSVPFFSLLTIYALLRFSHEIKYFRKITWLAVGTASLAIASQLHFLALFTLFPTSLIYFFIRYRIWDIKRIRKNRPFLNKQFWVYMLIAVSVITITYSPVIISELATGGSNSTSFIKAFSTKPQSQPLAEKLLEHMRQDIFHTSLLTTSIRPAPGFSIFPYVIGAAIILGGGLLLFHSMAKTQSTIKKNTLAMVVILISIFYTVSLPIAFQIHARYYTPVFFVPFILLGLVFQYLEAASRKYGRHLALVFCSFLILANLHQTFLWFYDQHRSQSQGFALPKSVLLKNPDGVSLGQMQRVAKYIADQNDSAVVYWVKGDYMSPLKYVLEQQKKLPVEAQYLERVYDIDSFSNFYIIVPATKGLSAAPSEYTANAETIDSFQAGQLVVYKMQIDPIDAKTFIKTKDEKRSAKKTARLYWKDILYPKSGAIAGSELDEETEEQ